MRYLRYANRGLTCSDDPVWKMCAPAQRSIIVGRAHDAALQSQGRTPPVQHTHTHTPII